MSDSLPAEEVEVVQGYRGFTWTKDQTSHVALRLSIGRDGADFAFWGKIRSFNECCKCCISFTSLLWQVPFSLQPSIGALASEPATPQKLNKLIKKAGSVLGTALELLELVGERRMLHKLLNEMDNTPSHNLLVRQQSVFNQKLLQLCCNEDCHLR